MRVVILADDLTGAADSAAGFAARGMRTAVAMNYGEMMLREDDWDVLAVDHNSRNLDEVDAVATMLKNWALTRRAGTWVYKKIDSTLRGNWAAEVAALTGVSGDIAVVAPAFPEIGRTTVGGMQYLYGEPLDASRPYGSHLNYPGTIIDQLRYRGIDTVHLSLDVVRSSPDKLYRTLTQVSDCAIQAIVADAQTPDDLTAIAAASVRLSRGKFWVGSGGLAAAMGRYLKSEGRYNIQTIGAGNRRCRRVLVVIGTPAPQSQHQADRLIGECGLGELVIPESLLARGSTYNHRRKWQLRACVALKDVDLVLRTSNYSSPPSASRDEGIANSLAELIRPLAEDVDGIVLTGGSTARAVLTSISISLVEVKEEISTGLVLSEYHAGIPSRIVTKAGSFGGPWALCTAYRQLKGTMNTRPFTRLRSRNDT